MQGQGISVITFNGTDWISLGSEINTYTVYSAGSVNIALDDNGDIYIGYIE